MYLNDVAMLAASTSRSKFYLEGLIKKKLMPAHVIFLINDSQKLLPGQKNTTLALEIIQLLNDAKINYSTSKNNDINSREIISEVSKRKEKVFIFSGFGGSLLKEEILNLDKYFLHVHGGYLPDYKGSTTNYFSLLNESSIGASSIFLTKDIDSGPILLRRKFPAPKNRNDIDYTIDSEVRTQILIETIEQYLRTGMWSFEEEHNSGGDTYYIIHPVLKHLSILADEALK